MGASAEQPLTRRQTLAGAGLTIAVPALAACGADESAAPTAPTPESTAPERSPSPATTPEASEPTSEPSSVSPDAESAQALVAASAVPVGGGVVVEQSKVVVTQPTEGAYRGFSAVCTHQGCLVGRVADGTIQCPCHGSRFSIEDGSVQGGPAPEPLPPVELVVVGDRISSADGPRG